MRLTTSQRISDGDSSDVFRSVDGKRVYKLYRRAAHPKYVNDPPRLFQNEVIAYEAAMRTEFIRAHVPQFYGKTEVADVVDDSGQSLIEAYHGDCCLELAFIPGECRKIGEIPEECEHVPVALMRSIGEVMRCTFDGSFFNWCDQDRVIAIDFAENV